jgi:hypothetical protein
MNFYDARGLYFSQEKGETKWRFPLQVVALTLGRIFTLQMAGDGVRGGGIELTFFNSSKL